MESPSAAAEQLAPNTYYITVSGSGTPECDGLYVPSMAPADVVSDSGTKSNPGYWNGRFAWDRSDGRAALRNGKPNPSLSYSNSYKAWRIARLDGHLAYTIVTDTDLPPTDTPWDVYRKGEAPAPTIVLHHQDPRPRVVFVLGGPGAGKGTMCELAQQQLGWGHLSAGDLLRAERSRGGERADLINSIIVAGKIVPSEITCGLLWTEIQRMSQTTKNFLVDGFPRNQENVDAWEAVVGRAASVQFMLFFECPLPVLEERILGRASYSGRKDDNVESLRLRFNTYKNETMPIVNLFRKKKQCIEVDSSLAREAVYALVKESLSEMTDRTRLEAPLTEHSECLLGLRAWPKKAPKS